MRLAVLDPASGSLSGLATPYSAFGPLSAVPRPGGRIALALVGGQPTRPSEAALLEVSSLQHVTSSWKHLKEHVGFSVLRLVSFHCAGAAGDAPCDGLPLARLFQMQTASVALICVHGLLASGRWRTGQRHDAATHDLYKHHIDFPGVLVCRSCWPGARPRTRHRHRAVKRSCFQCS